MDIEKTLKKRASLVLGSAYGVDRIEVEAFYYVRTYFKEGVNVTTAREKVYGLERTLLDDLKRHGLDIGVDFSTHIHHKDKIPFDPNR